MSYITKNFLHALRTEFNKQSNHTYKTSHIAEALASGYGYKSYASCLIDIKKHNRNINDFNSLFFNKKLSSWYPENILYNIDSVLYIFIWEDGIKNALSHIPDAIIIGETDNTASKIFEQIFNDVLAHPISDLSFTFKKEDFQIRYRLYGEQHIYHHKNLLKDDISNLKSYLLEILGIDEGNIKAYPAVSCQISKYINTPYTGTLRVSASPLPGSGIYINARLYYPSIEQQENSDIVLTKIISDILTSQNYPMMTDLSMKFIGNDVHAHLSYEIEDTWKRYKSNLSQEELSYLKEYFFQISELNQASDCTDISKNITICNQSYLLRMNIIKKENDDTDVVIRLKKTHIHSPQSLGIPSAIIDGLSKPGIHLFAGPTGSGKTTALYSLLQNILNQGNSRIRTYEDIIEFPLQSGKGVATQIESFSDYDRVNIRKDKVDYLVVGETRQEKDVSFIINESQNDSNLKVISTIHSNNVASIISRIINITNNSEIDLHNITTLVSQRFIRDNVKKRRILIREYLIFNDNVKKILKDIPVIEWKNTINDIFKEYSGKDSDYIQCESFNDALLRAYKEDRISLECLKENIHLS